MKDFFVKQFILTYLDMCPSGYDSFKLYKKIRWISTLDRFVKNIAELESEELIVHAYRFHDGTNFVYVETFAEIPSGTLPEDVTSWVTNW